MTDLCLKRNAMLRDAGNPGPGTRWGGGGAPSAGAGPHNDGLLGRRSCRRSRRDARGQALPLPDGEAMHAAVTPERFTGLAHDRAATFEAAGLPLDERGVIAVGHEADLLAVWLLGDSQPQSPCDIAHRILRQTADREAGARQLFLRQRKQKIRLILCAIQAAAEHMTSGFGIDADTRVMSRRPQFGT